MVPRSFLSFWRAAAELEAGAGIETGAWLVRQKKVGARQERFGEFHPPPETARKRFREIGGAIPEAESIQQRHCFIPELLAPHSVEMPVMSHIFEGGELRVQAGFLEDNADFFADGGGVRDDGAPKDAGVAFLRFHQGGQYPEKSGLSPAVGSEERENFAAIDLKTDPGQGEAISICVAQSFNVQRLGAGHFSSFEIPLWEGPCDSDFPVT